MLAEILQHIYIYNQRICSKILNNNLLGIIINILNVLSLSVLIFFFIISIH